jgi:LPS sulfotransferase NodH
MRTFLILAICALAGCAGDPVAFTDVKADTARFMAWEKEIQLTPNQEAVKRAALEALPAACCGDNSAYTCCCPCNLSRSVWGLSQYLVAKENYSATQVREKVASWIEYVNPDGFSGQACYKGGCPRPFSKDGCGGMNPNEVNF